MSSDTPEKPSGGGAWITLEETMSTMSPEKIKSEKHRHDVGLILGPVLFAIILLIPMGELTIKANLAIGLTAWIMVWWITEPIPIPATALFGAALFILFQVIPAPTIMNQLGNSNTWYLIATFIFMNALVKQGFATRVAYWLLSRKIGRRSPYHLLGLYVFSVGFVSIWLSNMACTMLFLAISAGMIEALQITSDHKMSQAMRLGAAYSSQAGGFGTPMGSAGTNFLTIGLITSLAGYSFTVGSWIKAGFPFAILMIIVVIFYFRAIFKLDLPNYQAACDHAKNKLDSMGKMKKGEVRAVIIVLCVLVCWLMPDFFQAIFGAQAQITVTAKSILNSATVAIIGAVLCFLVPVEHKERKYIINWTEANRYIDWGALLLVTCGLIMGAALADENVGVLNAVATVVGNALGNVPEFVGVLVLIGIAVVLTQFIANVPAISIMLPVSYAIAIAIGLNPVALLLSVGFACQQSYMTPAAAPQMAFTYGTGSIPMINFIKYGGFLALISIFVTTFAGYYFAAMLFPM